MTRTLLLVLVTVAVAVLVTIAGTTAMASRTDTSLAAGRTDTSCTCSTVDVGSGSVTLLVVANGSDTASISQQVSQINDHARVQIDAEYDDATVEIAGETAANGSLVLNVTRDDEVVNESVVVEASETVTVHLGSDDVRVGTDRDMSAGCVCEDVDDVDKAEAVDDGEFADSAGVFQCAQDDVGVEVNVGEEVDVDVGDEVEVNADEEDSSASGACADSPVGDDSRGVSLGEVVSELGRGLGTGGGE